MSHTMTLPAPTLRDLFSASAPTWLTELSSPLAAWSTRLARQGRMSTVDARDLAQEAVCRMMATYGTDKLERTPPPVLRAIAYRALRNMVVDEARRSTRAPVRDVGHDTIDPTPTIDHTLVEAQDRTHLGAALATLGANERAFVMAVMELDSVPAAQKRAGWPKASPYYHLRLILGRLRDHMEASAARTPHRARATDGH